MAVQKEKSITMAPKPLPNVVMLITAHDLGKEAMLPLKAAIWMCVGWPCAW